MTTTAETRGHFRCSFCGKTSVEVKKLVAGPGVYICDGCVALCGEMIAEEDPLDTPRLPTDARQRSCSCGCAAWPDCRSSRA